MRNVLKSRIKNQPVVGLAKNIKGSWEVYSLILLGISLPYVIIEPSPFDIIFFGLGFLFLIKYSVNKIALTISVVYFLAILLSCVWGLISITIDTSSALRYLIIESYLILGLLGLSALLLNKTEYSFTIVKSYIAGAAISSIIALIIIFGPDNLDLLYRTESKLRVQGFFKDPNVLAPYLILPITASLFYKDLFNSNISRYLTFFSCGLLLLLSLSRGGYVGLVAALGLWLLLSNLKKIRLRQLLLITSVSIAFISILLFTDIFQRLEFLAVLVERSQLQDYDQKRFFHILNGLEVGLLKPFGLGPAGYGAMYDTNPHNLFVGKLVDSGLASALIITSFILLSFLKPALGYLKKANKMSLLLCSTMFGQAVCSLVVYSQHWRHMLLLSVVALCFMPSKPVGSSIKRAKI